MQGKQARSIRGIARFAALLAAAAFAVTLAAPTADAADDKGKTTERTAGRFVKWDKEGGTVTVKVKGKDEVYNVVAEGSVLARTTVTVKAKPGKLDDLKEGMIVQLYWKPNATDATKKDARKIDSVSVPEGGEPEEEEY
jgi:hypothetical protein